MASLYELGEGVRLRAVFTDPVTGNDTDPTTITLRVLAPPQAPGGSTVTAYPAAPVVKDAVGRYSALITADAVGLWQYRWEGENAAPSVQEGSFVVRRTEVI